MATTGEFIFDQLREAGVRHVFHMPGNHSLGLAAIASKAAGIEMVGCSSEAAAAHAADAYARVTGLGVVMVTHGVGAYSAMNAVACAYAEKSPLVVLSGAPGVRERKEVLLQHHMVRTYDSPKKVFLNVTCDVCVLADPGRATLEFERVLEACRRQSQPVYIEVPRDIVSRPVSLDVDSTMSAGGRSNHEALREAVDTAAKHVQAASRPVIICGVEASRLRLEKRIVRMAEDGNIPIATTILGKSAVSERHPLCLGVYAGTMSPGRVRQVVEHTDCLVCLGVIQTDINCGFYPARLAQTNGVVAAMDSLRVRNSHFEGVDLRDFVEGLYAVGLGKRTKPQMPTRDKPGPWEPVSGRQITANRLFARLAGMLDKDSAIMADIGEGLFGSMDFPVHDTHRYFCPAFYGTMGYAIPASLGVMKACPSVRPIIITGDGSFQMSCPELGNFVRYGLNPQVFVVNNGGYATERLMLDGPWCNIPAWKNHRVVDMLGKGLGLRVETEDQLEDAIRQCQGSRELSVVDVVLPPGDSTDAIKRYAEKFKGCR